MPEICDRQGAIRTRVDYDLCFHARWGSMVQRDEEYAQSKGRGRGERGG